LGELAHHNIEHATVHAARDLILNLDDDGELVRIQHGFVKAESPPEQAYLFDYDFYREARTEKDAANQVLSIFNRESGRLFRWCISERLHDAMGPQAVSP
jgi:uncharacterized protein (TIGR04255 family)